MTYLRSLFLNFLVVFFVDRVIPGIEVQMYENVPNIGADILFSGILGFLNASIYPGMYILSIKPTLAKIVVVAGIFSFLGFIIISFIDYGVQVQTFFGGFLSGLIVWAVSVLTNYLEMKHSHLS